MKKLRIALLGTRGIPAAYGGFETFAEELSTRLNERGHQVTVFCRKFPTEKKSNSIYRNVQLRYAYTLPHKYLETPLHAFFSNLKLSSKKFDVALLCNAANSPFAWMINLLKIPLAINVDGIERERGKWNALGRAWYALGERASVLFADRVIADAKVIQEYYKERYRCDATMIAYGASAQYKDPGATLKKFNLSPEGYILYVSRLEPENNALGVIKAYNKSRSQFPLVIVGDAPYAHEYKEQLYREAAGNSIIFTGYQFGENYQELQSHCYCYIQATEVGGTHPALIEAMAYGNCIIANGTPENREVLAEGGILYEKNDFEQLAELIQRVVEEPTLRKDLKIRAKQRAQKNYSWDAVTDAYERLFLDLIS